MDAPETDRLRELDALIRRAQESPLDRVTVLVATRAAGVHLRRGLGTVRGLCNVVFRTLEDLVTELARTVLAPGRRVANVRVQREALRQVLLAERADRSALAHSPRAIAELTGVLGNLWLADERALPALRQSGADGTGLVILLDAVERHLAAHGFADPGSLVDAAARTEDPRGALGTLVAWRLPPLAGRHRAFLDALRQRGVTVYDAPGEGGGVAPATRVVGCSDPDEEVRTVLRRVAAAADAGVPLWRIAVVHPAGDRYRRIVHQQFARAGVPVSGTGPGALSESATGRAALGLLSLAGSPWRRDEVMRWLESAPISVPPHGGRAPVDRWDDVSARAGVVDGLDQWAERLARFAAGGTGRRDHVAHIASESDAAGRLAEFVAQLAREADPGDRRRWWEFSDWTRRLLDRYLLPEDEASVWPPIERLAASDVRQVVFDLKALDAVSSGTDLAWFRHTLAGELRSRRLRRDREADEDADAPLDVRVLPGATGNGVFVGSFGDARGLDFDRCFAVGLADGVAPAYVDEGLLPDLGTDAPPGWPTTLSRQDDQRSDFWQALATARDHPVVTWPRVDPRTGRELTRSRWLDGLAAGDQVSSFEAGLRGVLEGDTAASGADRLLALLYDAAGRPADLREHPLVARDEDDPDPLGAIALREAYVSAVARLSPEFSRFDGYVGSIGSEQAGIDRELSPTRLEQYAHCPRRFLLDRQLRVLAPFRPEANEQMEPRDRGTLIHAILESYVRERVERGAPASLDRLLAIGRDQFAAAEAEGRCGMPLMAHVERLTLERELRRFFDEDILQPVAVELRFGGAAANHDVADDRLEIDEPVERPESEFPALEVRLGDGRRLRFGGSIDRVDHAVDGTTVVSDYKTGTQRDLAKLAKDPVAGGTKLQLPIYAMAARAYLAPIGPVRARYWLTSWQRSSPTFECDLSPALEERATEAMGLIVSGIEAGAFPGVPGELDTMPGGTFDNCRFCDFDRLCPADRDRRWSTVRSSAVVSPVVELKEDPPGDVGGLVREGVLAPDGGGGA
jgi:ATP-dependent helicase/nuclease subunit B